jgi:hypothetical protein
MSRQNEEDQINNHNESHKKDKSVKVFDWIKAAKLIKEYHIQNASVGFDHSGGKTFTILKNGKPVKNNGDDMIPLFDEANPVLINDDRREIMNCFVVIHDGDNNNSTDINSFKSDKKMILLKWPKEALDIINRQFYRKDIQESKYFQFLMTMSNPLFYVWPLLGFV